MAIIEDLYLPSRQRTDDAELEQWIQAKTGQPTHPEEPPTMSLTITPPGVTQPVAQNVGQVAQPASPQVGQVGQPVPQGREVGAPPGTLGESIGKVAQSAVEFLRVKEPSPEFMQEFQAQWQAGPFRDRPMPAPSVLGMLEQTMMIGPHGAAPTAGGPGGPRGGPRGGPPRVAEAPIADLVLDPQRFQYKVQQAAGGTTGSLAGVEKFDPNLAGVIQVWQDPANGLTYVVNGHNRVALAQRTGQESIAVRYLNAATAEEARTIGALTNIAEGRGNAIDAAKLFRDTGMTVDDLQARGVPLREKIAADGLALANLQDSLFNDVVQGTLPLERGIIIGSKITDPDQQLKLAQLLRAEAAKGRRTNVEQVRELADFVQSAPSAQVTQETLFGAEETAISLALDKARIAAAIRERLATDKALFARVSKESAAQRLTEAGTVVNVEEAQRIAQQSGQLLDLFDRLKYGTGEISDILNDAAEQLRAGGNAADIADAIYPRLTEALPAAIARGEGPSVSGAPGGVQPGQFTTSTGDTLTGTAERTRGAVSEAGIPVREQRAELATDIFGQPPASPPGQPPGPPGVEPPAAQPPGAPSPFESAFASPGRFNPMRQAASGKIKQLTAEINVLARDLGIMETQTRGTITHEDTLAAAKELVRRGTVDADFVLNLQPGDILNAEYGTAARLIRDATVKRAEAIELAAKAGDPAAKDRLIASKYLASIMETAAEAASGTEPARAVSARRILSRPRGLPMSEFQELIRTLPEQEWTAPLERGAERMTVRIQQTLNDAAEQATTPGAKQAVDAITQEVNTAIESTRDPRELMANIWGIILKGAMQAEEQALDPDLLQMIVTKVQDDITRAVPEGMLVGGLWENIVQGVTRAEQSIDPDLLLEFTSHLTNQAEREAYTKYFAETTRTGRWANALLEARQGGLLTHRSILRNLGGSSATTVWSVPERATTAVIGSVRQTPDGAYAYEAIEMLHGIWQERALALSDAKRAFQTGRSQFIAEGSALEGVRLNAMSSEALRLNGTMGRVIDVWGEISRFMFRGLVAGDDLLKHANYSAEKYAQAYRYYRTMLAEGATEAQASAKYADLIENPHLHPWLHEQAEQHALYQTFNDEIINPVGKAIMGVRAREDGWGIASRGILPFARTPMNVMGFGAERTPGLNLLSSHYWQEIAARGVRKDAAYARLGLGIGMYMTFVGFAMNGLINGKGPKDPKLRAMNREAGILPYSVNLPGTNPIPILGYSPFSEILGNAADFADLAFNGANDADLDTLATAMVLSTADVMAEYPMVKGLADIADAIRTNDSRSGGFITQALRGVLPFPGLGGHARTLSQLTDPHERETRSPHGDWSRLGKEVVSLWDTIAAYTPFLQNYQYPQRDIIGRPMQRQGGWWTLAPNAPSAQEPHPIYDELLKQGVAIGQPPKAFGRGKQAMNGVDPEGIMHEPVVLSSEEWDKFRRYAGQELTINRGGKPLNLDDYLRELIVSPRYLKEQDGPRGGKATLLKEAFDEHREAAKMQVIKESSRLQKWLAIKEAVGEFEQLSQEQAERARPRLEKKLSEAYGEPKTVERGRRGLTIR